MTCTGRSSSRPCGPGRCRSTSGSAAWPRGRRSSRWPRISPGDEWSASVARKVALGAVLPAPVAADRRPRPPGALPEHAAHLQAALADEHGRVVPGFVQRHRRRRRRRPTCSASPHGAQGWVRRPRCSAATSAPTPACCWRSPPCRCGPAAASFSVRSSSRPLRRPAPPPRVWCWWRRGGARRDTPPASRCSRLEVAAILAELMLSAVNQRRLGRAGQVLSEGRAGRLFRTAQAARRDRRRAESARPHGVSGRAGQNVASVLYLARRARLPLRMDRGGEGVGPRRRGRCPDGARQGHRRRAPARADGAPDRFRMIARPAARGAAPAATRAWSRTVGRASLLVERLLRRG